MTSHADRLTMLVGTIVAFLLYTAATSSLYLCGIVSLEALHVKHLLLFPLGIVVATMRRSH